MANLIAITTNTIITIKVEYLWFNLIKFFLPFGNFLSENLEIESAHSFERSATGVPLNFQWRSGSGSATQSFSSEWEWECHSKNKGVLNPLPNGVW